ncbi:MAG: tRNA-specific adenosine deaminase [Alphaproteobacteria bacterium RIFCSPLOWO2_01_FULL_45_8]|nr:MAG: tRNA-specific adenosine deaminase [Alphaproteobacteria bacterium GWA1_45_9]OFW90278.1 MAG: tRNA-specific adenosine deaminase [Alphaproteobacteria bacterium RIFCSPHIGHO2_01_FULL_41_14]OFW95665.1 MAG: tRNA-specific adenosine deaminase [Alphaproteobacteria bacterium RIFCSPLOWO2_01_FULL_45_8]HCI48260.1 tRNA-specific adenosine deaminase [Holosporales bacterium]
MKRALQEAKSAASRGEVPVGAVIVCGNEILSTQSNRVIESKDPTAHAELLVIREACQKIGNERLTDCDLYVTLEPCAMCATAISLARIKTLYYGALDSKGGGVRQGAKVYTHATCHHRPEIVAGLLQDESSLVLQSFFQALRQAKKRGE